MSEEKKEITGLQKLRQPFPEWQISKLPKPYKKDSPKGNCDECGGYHGLPAVHLDYVGHAALTDRLLETDINWDWQPLAFDQDGLPRFDKTGGLWIKLTICGQTRLGYGHAANSEYKDAGSREKEIIGDALRNAAMRFGAALDLWHKGDLHGNSEENSNEETTSQPKENVPAPKPPNLASPGEFVINIGEKHKGKKLKDMNPYDLDSYIKYLTKNGQPKGETKNVVTAGEAYLKTLEVKK